MKMKQREKWMNTHNNGHLILVTGATGTQGGATVRHLLKHEGVRIRALTRDPNTSPAQALAAQGVEVVRGDFDDRTSLDQALTGAYGVFSVQNVVEIGDEGEARQGIALIDAAKAAGVKHIVQASAGGVGRAAGVIGLVGKQQVEEHLKQSGLRYTILRPTWFMSDWAWPMPFFRPSIENGRLALPLDPEKPLQQISPDDIGAFATLAFLKPERWAGRTVEIAGDERTMPEVAAALSRVLGRPVEYRQITWEVWQEQAGDFFYRLFRWYNDVGYNAAIADLRQEYPALATLDGYLQSSQWKSSVVEMGQ